MDVRDIDFILVSSTARKNPRNGYNLGEIRVGFERSLENEGLILEKEKYGCLTFIKIHAPKTVLRKYCEIMKFRMPLKQSKEDAVTLRSMPRFSIWKLLLVDKIKDIYCYFVEGDLHRNDDRKKFELCAFYARDKNYLFDESDPNFFSRTVRILVVHFILNRQNWSKNETNENCVGLEKLLNDNIYVAAYPLHDGDCTEYDSIRNKLFVNWAHLNCWFKIQPIDEIKEYLGIKYGFYFAWLGFYTRLLIPATIFGILVFLYGYVTLPTDEFSNGICTTYSNLTMCPTCDFACDYYKLGVNCLYARMTYLFDNNFTVVFAFLMAIWASTFLELWKRYSAVINHRWGLSEYSVEEENARPEFTSKLESLKGSSYSTRTENEDVSLWKIKFPGYIISYSTILFFISLIIIAVSGIVVYRLWIAAFINSMHSSDWLKNHGSFIISGSAATINLFVIMILNILYSRVAEYLNDLEMHRTQIEYDTALTVKIYIFQFINYYSSIFYIAFFKGKFVGYPGHYKKIFGYRQEECNYGGCLLDMSIQLAFIMIGKQLLGAIFEISLPAFQKFLKTRNLKNTGTSNNFLLKEQADISKAKSSRWVNDYKLLDYDVESRGLFSEYLEMVMQFGFVTLFVPAFPLAPLFAWINNYFEIRLDAHKILKYYRRPIPYRVPNIGIWFQILKFIGNLAVITNAVVIAFSSSFIPKFVYLLHHSANNKSDNFLGHSLSMFDITDFNSDERPENTAFKNISVCMYQDSRQPPQTETKYAPTYMYWEVFVARLIFIILFQNVVYAVKSIIQYWIPDEPKELLQLKKREYQLTVKHIIKNEAEKTTLNSEDGKNDNLPTLGKNLLDDTLQTGIIRLKNFSMSDQS